MRAYGAGAYWNPAFPTRDQVVPWRTFVLLYSRLDREWAAERLRVADGTALAIGVTMGDKGGPASEEYKRLLRHAHPTGA